MIQYHAVSCGCKLIFETTIVGNECHISNIQIQHSDQCPAQNEMRAQLDAIMDAFDGLHFLGIDNDFTGPADALKQMEKFIEEQGDKILEMNRELLDANSRLEFRTQLLDKTVERMSAYREVLRFIANYKPADSVSFSWRDEWKYVRERARKVLYEEDNNGD